MKTFLPETGDDVVDMCSKCLCTTASGYITCRLSVFSTSSALECILSLTAGVGNFIILSLFV